MTEPKNRESRISARPWETINPFDTMREVMNRMLETVLEPLGRLAPSPLHVPVQRFQPSVDVIEEDDDVRVEVEVPGMSVEDLSVTIHEDSVVVRGEKKPEGAEAVGVHRRERSYGAFRRVIHLPVEVDRDKAEATFKNGILVIVLPKSHEAAKKVQIKVG